MPMNYPSAGEQAVEDILREGVPEVNTEQTSIAGLGLPSLFYYLIAKKDSNYYVIDTRQGKTVYEETDEHKAQTAFQYAYDNAPRTAAIGVIGRGMDDPYYFTESFKIDNGPTAFFSLLRHGTQLEGYDDGTGYPSELILVDYSEPYCSMVKGFQIANGGGDGIRVESYGGADFRIWDIHNGPGPTAVSGYGIRNNSGDTIALGGSGTIRGQTGCIYSDGDVYRSPTVAGANIDGGTGNIILHNEIPGNEFIGDVRCADGSDLDANDGCVINANAINDWFGQTARIEFASDKHLIIAGGAHIFLEADAREDDDRVHLNDFENLNPLSSAPTSPQEGDIVIADGTSWDPGSGEGAYRYTSGGTWSYLG